jgi:UBA-like domain
VASADMADNNLSPSQNAALQQLQTLTNGGDTDVAIGVLESVEWDIHVSCNFIGKAKQCSFIVPTIIPELPN